MINPTALLTGLGAGIAAALIGITAPGAIVIGATGTFVAQLAINKKAKG